MRHILFTTMIVVAGACDAEPESVEVAERMYMPCVSNSCTDDPSLGWWNGAYCVTCTLDPDPYDCPSGRYATGECKPYETPCDSVWNDGSGSWCEAGYVGDPAECFATGQPDNCSGWPTPEPILGCCNDDYGFQGKCAAFDPDDPDVNPEDYCIVCDRNGGFCIECDRGVMYDDGSFDCWDEVVS